MPAESPWLDRREAAKYLGVSPKTLNRWASEGGGPPYFKLRHNLTRYTIADLDAWVRSQPRLHTADDGSAAEILRQKESFRAAHSIVGRRRL